MRAGKKNNCFLHDKCNTKAYLEIDIIQTLTNTDQGI